MSAVQRVPAEETTPRHDRRDSQSGHPHFRPATSRRGRRGCDRRDCLADRSTCPMASPYEWVLEGDITACFDEIDHAALLCRVRDRIGEPFASFGSSRRSSKPVSSPRTASRGTPRWAHENATAVGRLLLGRLDKPLAKAIVAVLRRAQPFNHCVTTPCEPVESGDEMSGLITEETSERRSIGVARLAARLRTRSPRSVVPRRPPHPPRGSSAHRSCDMIAPH